MIRCYPLRKVVDPVLQPISKGGEMRKRYIKGVQAAGEENYEPMIQLIGELFPSN